VILAVIDHKKIYSGVRL